MLLDARAVALAGRTAAFKGHGQWSANGRKRLQQLDRFNQLITVNVDISLGSGYMTMAR